MGAVTLVWDQVGLTPLLCFGSCQFACCLSRLKARLAPPWGRTSRTSVSALSPVGTASVLLKAMEWIDVSRETGNAPMPSTGVGAFVIPESAVVS